MHSRFIDIDLTSNAKDNGKSILQLLPGSVWVIAIKVRKSKTSNCVWLHEQRSDFSPARCTSVPLVINLRLSAYIASLLSHWFVT
jgi:hypothetical protein